MTLARLTALAVVAFLVAVVPPYLGLIATFGYDDVLREPPAEILARFQAGGPSLIWTWFAFALAAGLFAPASLLFGAWLDRRGAGVGAALGWIGAASALVQCAALLRWTFVVPPLAAAHAGGDPGAAAAFQAQHAFGGALLGEFVGQMLMAVWLVLAAIGLVRARRGAWLAIPALVSAASWVLAQGELLAAVGALPTAPEVAPFAFLGFEVWLALLAGVLAFAPRPEVRP